MADNPPRKFEITHLNHNNTLFTKSSRLCSRVAAPTKLKISLLEGVVENVDVSSMICGIVASTHQAAQLTFAMCSTIGRAANDTTYGVFFSLVE